MTASRKKKKKIETHKTPQRTLFISTKHNMSCSSEPFMCLDPLLSALTLWAKHRIWLGMGRGLVHP